MNTRASTSRSSSKRKGTLPASMSSKSKKSTRKAKSASGKNGRSTSSRSTRAAGDENDAYMAEISSPRRSEGRGTPSYYDDPQMNGGSRRQLDRWTDDQEIEDRRNTGRFADNDNYDDESSYRSTRDRSDEDIEREGSRSYRADEERYGSSGSGDWDRMERGGSRRGSREGRNEDYERNERFGSRQDRYGANDYGYRDDREGYSMSGSTRRDLRDFENDEDLHEGTRGTRTAKKGSDHKSDRNFQSNRGSRTSRRV